MASSLSDESPRAGRCTTRAPLSIECLRENCLRQVCLAQHVARMGVQLAPAGDWSSPLSDAALGTAVSGAASVGSNPGQETPRLCGVRPVDIAKPARQMLFLSCRSDDDQRQ